MSDKLVCAWCGNETHDDTSNVFHVFTTTGIETERRCFDCDPPEGDWE